MGDFDVDYYHKQRRSGGDGHSEGMRADGWWPSPPSPLPQENMRGDVLGNDRDWGHWDQEQGLGLPRSMDYQLSHNVSPPADELPNKQHVGDWFCGGNHNQDSAYSFGHFNYLDNGAWSNPSNTQPAVSIVGDQNSLSSRVTHRSSVWDQGVEKNYGATSSCQEMPPQDNQLETVVLRNRLYEIDLNTLGRDLAVVDSQPQRQGQEQTTAEPMTGVNRPTSLSSNLNDAKSFMATYGGELSVANLRPGVLTRLRRGKYRREFYL